MLTHALRMCRHEIWWHIYDGVAGQNASVLYLRVLAVFFFVVWSVVVRTRRVAVVLRPLQIAQLINTLTTC